MFGNFSLFKTPFPGTELRPSLFCLFFCLLYFFLPPFEELGCFSGCLMSSAGIPKLFCGIYSTFKCSFDEFVGEKVFSPSYSSAILAPPPEWKIYMHAYFLNSKHKIHYQSFCVHSRVSIHTCSIKGSVYHESPYISGKMR